MSFCLRQRRRSWGEEDSAPLTPESSRLFLESSSCGLRICILMRSHVLLTMNQLWKSPYSFRLPTCLCKSLGVDESTEPVPRIPTTPPLPPTLLHLYIPLCPSSSHPSLADHNPCPGESHTRSRLSNQGEDT